MCELEEPRIGPLVTLRFLSILLAETLGEESFCWCVNRLLCPLLALDLDEESLLQVPSQTHRRIVRTKIPFEVQFQLELDLASVVSVRETCAAVRADCLVCLLDLYRLILETSKQAPTRETMISRYNSAAAR